MLAVIGAFAWVTGTFDRPSITLPAVPRAVAPAPIPEAELPQNASDDIPQAADDLDRGVRPWIEQAARVVGFDTGYLLAVAARESRFNPAIHAQGTTASGLYQFTEDTWLRAVKFFGARHGLAGEARLITSNAQGEFSLSDARVRSRLMSLRADPKLAALMAAELARDNKQRLEHILGRTVTPSETYLAHLLGVGSAARAINAVHTTPHMPAAWLLPTAAKNNPGVFLSAGRTLSVRAMVAKVKADFEREVPRFTVT